MNLEKQREIEQRAYALWEREGQPHGRHEEHWLRAAHEIEAEEFGGTAMKRPSPKKSGRASGKPPRRKTKTKAKA